MLVHWTPWDKYGCVILVHWTPWDKYGCVTLVHWTPWDKYVCVTLVHWTPLGQVWFQNLKLTEDYKFEQNMAFFQFYNISMYYIIS